MKKQKSNKPKKDIFGLAAKAYYESGDKTDIIVHSPDFDDDIIPVQYLFRGYNEMPEIEQKALNECAGRVLDVGCGAGSHALYLQQENGQEVKAIDISPGMVEITKLRGIIDAENINFFDLKNEKFDTLLCLMNGTGIIEKLSNLDYFFQHCKKLLSPTGKILMDSSDLRFLFDEDEDGGIWIDKTSYYGELDFRISYKNEISEPFPWLYIDFDLLELAAAKNGFSCNLMLEGEHYNYLAELKLNSKT